MELTEEQLAQIEEYGSHFFTPLEIARIMKLDADEFMVDFDAEGQVRDSIERGQLKSEAEVRKSIFDLAKSGSGPAQVLAVGIIEKYQLKKISV